MQSPETKGNPRIPRHTNLVALHAEPNGNNPPKLIGYICPDNQLLTARHQWSLPSIATQKAPGAPLRTNHAHAARVRAAEALGNLMVVEAEDG